VSVPLKTLKALSVIFGFFFTSLGAPSTVIVGFSTYMFTVVPSISTQELLS
jgi:hypothetical protein